MGLRSLSNLPIINGSVSGGRLLQLATVLGNRRIRQTCSLREQVDYYQQDDE